MVFLAKLGFENLKNLVTPSSFCKVGRVTELLDGRVISSPWKTKHFQGLEDDFGLKKPNHHLGPEYLHIFRGKKVWYMRRLFWEISSSMQKPWRSYKIWRYTYFLGKITGIDYLWMRCCRVAKASDSLCRSCNCPGFNPSILRHTVESEGRQMKQCWIKYITLLHT